MNWVLFHNVLINLDNVISIERPKDAVGDDLYPLMAIDVKYNAGSFNRFPYDNEELLLRDFGRLRTVIQPRLIDS